MHERQSLREAVVSQLLGNTSVGIRVYKSRLGPLRQHELPAISVYTDEEIVDPASRLTAPRELTRSVALVIEAWAKASENIDDILDSLALEIETVMDIDLELSGTAFSSVLSSTEVGLKLDGERPMGCVHLEYTVTYHTDLRTSAQDASRSNFNTLATQYDVDGNVITIDRANDLKTGIY